MKKLSLGIASTFLFVTIAALAANFTDDQLQFGKPGSSANKEIVFGASNKKKLKHVPGTLTLDYEGNNLSVGDGLNTSDKTLKLNKGAGSPTFRHNFTSGDLEIENAPVLNQKGNTVSVGDGTNTNKVLKFNKGANSPEIRFNSTTAKLEFSNDASLYKAIGSGSGAGEGGKNLLTNGSFEDGISLEWQNTGGTFTQGTYTNGTDDDSKFANFVASAAGQYFETTLLTVPDSLGVGCMSDLKYFGGGGNFKLQVLDASSNLLAETVLADGTAWKKSSTIAYPCPAPGATLRARIISTAAGTIQADQVYLGGNKNLAQVSLAKFAGESYFESQPACTWTYTLSTLGQFNATAACPGPTVVTSSVGTWLTTDVDRPIQTVQNLPAGIYKATFFVRTNMSIAAGSQLAINDGLTTCQPVSSEDSASASSGQSISCSFTYATPQASRSFQLFGAVTANTIIIQNATGTLNNKTKFLLEYWPLDSETAVSNEQSSWLIDANIGGATITVAGIQSTFTEITNGSLDLVLNSAKNSAPAEIPCSSTNPSTGVTCAAGNESLGIVFTPPYAGQFEVCADFWFNGATGAYKTFQLIETPNNAQTILQEGGQRTGGGGSVTDYSHHVCGTFKFDSVTKRTIRLMYESQDAGNSVIAIARDAGLGQRDMKITVRPVLQNVARPVLTGDQVTTPGATNPKTYMFEFGQGSRGSACTVGPCTLHLNQGGLVSSVTKPGGAGTYDVNINAGKFNGTNYSCVVSNATAQDSVHCGVGIYTASSFRVNCAVPNISSTAVAATVICMGQ